MENQEPQLVVNGLPIPRERVRRRFVASTMLFCGVAIAAICWKGDPANSLHSSALAWSFATSAATLFAYVFGAVVDNANLFASKK